MRILFLDSNPVFIHLLPNGFRDLGHSVEILGSLTSENLPRKIESFRPHLIITEGAGPETIKRKKQKLISKYAKAANIPLIYWSVEDPRYTESFVLPLLNTMQPDFVFTIDAPTADRFKSLGFLAAALEFGYHHSVNCPVNIDEKYICDIALVANTYAWDFERNDYKERLKYLNILLPPLIEKNIRVDIWGKGWKNMDPYLGTEIPRSWLHGLLPYTETNKVYSSAKIVIGLQSLPDQVTHRTYEILASGGFLLTNDTPEVRRLFIPGRDLVVSASPEETLETVQYFLEHHSKRQQIAREGESAVKTHHYKYRAESVLNVLQQHRLLPQICD